MLSAAVSPSPSPVQGDGPALPPLPANLFPSLDPSRSPAGPGAGRQRWLSPLPDSRFKAGTSSQLRDPSTCLRAGGCGVPGCAPGLGALVSTPQPRPCVPRSRRRADPGSPAAVAPESPAQDSVLPPSPRQSWPLARSCAATGPARAPTAEVLKRGPGGPV